MKKNPYGVFEITLPSENGKPAIPHNTKVKVRRPRNSLSLLEAEHAGQISMTKPSGERFERLPAWIKCVSFIQVFLCPADSSVERRVTQDLNVSPIYDAVFWNPPSKYAFKNKRPTKPEAVKVYEAHG